MLKDCWQIKVQVEDKATNHEKSPQQSNFFLLVTTYNLGQHKIESKQLNLP